MEVISINTNDAVNSKAELWTERIHAFQKSGLSQKDWCQQNEVPQSTLSYWIRKLRLETHETDVIPDPVFAKLPEEQDFQFSADTEHSPVIIRLPENIRIEIGADCPARLVAALLQTLNSHVSRKNGSQQMS